LIKLNIYQLSLTEKHVEQMIHRISKDSNLDKVFTLAFNKFMSLLNETRRIVVAAIGDRGIQDAEFSLPLWGDLGYRTIS
jgi:hypothetical protein